LKLIDCGLPRFPECLSGLTALEHLVVDGNRFNSSINLGIVPRTLRKLFMRRCNFVRLPWGFRLLPLLEELDVSRNSLGFDSLEALDDLGKQLHTLNISHNAINRFPDLSKLHSLQVLDISCNPMNNILPETLPESLCFLMVSDIPQGNLGPVQILGVHGRCEGYVSPYTPLKGALQAPNLFKLILYATGSVPAQTTVGMMELIRQYPHLIFNSSC
jgi:hypothetical protein